MKTTLLVAVVLVGSSCIDFEAKLKPDGGASDGGVDAGEDAGTDAGPTSDCPGFTAGGWCWANPAQSGEDLLAVLNLPDGTQWVGGSGGTIALRQPQATGPDQWTTYLQDPAWRIRGFTQAAGTLLAWGEGMPILVFSDAGWSPLRTSVPPGNVLSAVALDGGVVLVGTTSDNSQHTWSGLLVGTRLTTDAGVPGTLSSVVAGAWGTAVARTLAANGRHELVSSSGATSALSAFVDDQFTNVALWLDSEGTGFFVGGSGCVVVHARPLPDGTFDVSAPVEVCPSGTTNLIVTAGVWSPSLATYVLSARADTSTIIETTLDGGPSLLIQQALREGLNAVAPLPDGGAVVVGDTFTIIDRVDSGWRTDLRVLEDLNALQPRDGGAVLVFGSGQLVASASPGGGRVTSLSSPVFNADTYFSGWADEKSFVAVGGDNAGIIADGALTPTPVNLRTLPDAGTLRAVTSSAAGLVAFGDDGAFATQSGGWQLQHFPSPSPVDFSSATPFGGAVVAGATVTLDDGGVTGRLLRFDNGVLGDWRAVEFPVFAVSTAGKVLFAVGDDVGRGRFDATHQLDAGTLDCSNCFSTRLNAVFAVSDDEAWAVGAEGLVVHYLAGTWTRLPLVTPWTLSSVSVTTDGVHHWLWVAGEHGRLLRKQLD